MESAIIIVQPKVPRRGWRCPDELSLAGYIDGTLPGGKRAALETHIAGCAHCLAQVGFAIKLQGEELSPAPPALMDRVNKARAAETGNRNMVRRWEWAGAAAVAACALLAVLVVGRQPEQMPVQIASVPRSTKSLALNPPANGPKTNDVRERATRSRTSPRLSLLEPRPGMLVAARKAEFRWTKVPGALYYTIRIANADGDLIWDTKVEGERAELPTEVTLNAGQEYFVLVHAYLAEGKVIRTSATSFKVAP
jgi:hypothetical protein